jgi:hypothetical protein
MACVSHVADEAASHQSGGAPCHLPERFEEGQRRRRLNRAGNYAPARPTLSRLLANETSLSFGIAFCLDGKFENERQLRRLSATRPTREPQKATYF